MGVGASEVSGEDEDAHSFEAETVVVAVEGISSGGGRLWRKEKFLSC